MLNLAQYEGQRWRLLHVAPARERRVAEMLGERQIVAYVPVERLFVGVAHRKRVHERPLIRNYVFAQVSYDDQPIVAHLEHVRQVIGSNSPLVLRDIDQKLGALRSSEADGLFDQTIDKPVVYDRGDAVRLKSGPFSGFPATIYKLKSKRRAVVIVNLFGRGTRTTASLDDLEHAAAC